MFLSENNGKQGGHMKRLSDNCKTGKGRMDFAGEAEASFYDVDSLVESIQMLIPLGLKAVGEALQAEVALLAGESHARRDTSIRRWGYNDGSVYLGKQKVPVSVPRVRDVEACREIPLKTYEALRSPGVIEKSALALVLNGISQRKYEKAATLIPETFGIKSSSVSRHFVKASALELKKFLGRDLSGEDIVSIFVDGKRFAEHGIIVALGVTVGGKKTPLGFIESATENHAVCRDFINGLVERGLKVDDGILFVVDGSKGLHKGIKEALGERAFIQRCQWHKRENVVKYLDKRHQGRFRAKLQGAYEEPSYEKAKARLLVIRKELSLVNESAVASLDEGLEETLTLHKLGMFGKLGRSFKTTNCLESVNRQLGMYTGRVCRWRNSNMRQRWVASALMEIEPRLRKVSGYKHLPELREIMKRVLAGKKAARAA
jgi:transposase-like protein